MSMLPSAVIALFYASRHPARRPNPRKRLMRTVTVLLAICAAPALALPPEISHRYIVENPYKRNINDPVTGTISAEYVPSTAVAAGNDFALLGNGYPRLIYNSSQKYFSANPVFAVYRPWVNGGTRKDIAPPVNSPGGERFGEALAIHGNRVAIGASEVWGRVTSYYVGLPPNQTLIVQSSTTDGGRVHLYQYNGTNFVLERTIVYGGLNERFGVAVALDAMHLLVGRPYPYNAPGAADLFDADTGALITTFVSPSPTSASDEFGTAVALAGDLALVGAYKWSTVFVYRHDGAGTWNPAGELTSPGHFSDFGASIATDGERILVGAPGIDRAYIFEDDGDSDWPVVAELSGGALSQFGASVALVGDSAFIGAPDFTYSPLTNMGTVLRHDRAIDGTWPYAASKNAQTPESDGRFGWGIAASTNMLTVHDSKLANKADEMSVFTGPPPSGC